MEVVASFSVHLTENPIWCHNISVLVKTPTPTLPLFQEYGELVSSVLNLFCRFVGKECPEDGRENASAEGLPITTDTYASRYRKRASSILKDPTHQGHAVFVPLPSGRRPQSIKSRTTMLLDCFCVYFS